MDKNSKILAIVYYYTSDDDETTTAVSYEALWPILVINYPLHKFLDMYCFYLVSFCIKVILNLIFLKRCEIS